MLTNQFALNIAARLCECSTLTEQGVVLTQVFEEIRKDARIDTAEELAIEIKHKQFNGDLPMATWPNAQRIIAGICTDYAQNLQSGTDNTGYKSAESNRYSIGPALVTRDANGLWRHPLFPCFRADESAARSAWFKSQRLDTCGTYLAPPEDHEGASSKCENCRLWDVLRPSGDKWFLLAIETTSSGPVAVWAAKVGK